LKRLVVASLLVLGFLAGGWPVGGVLQAKPPTHPSSRERAAIVRAARPYIVENSVQGLTVTIKNVVLSSPPWFAAITIDSSAGGAAVLMRRLTTGGWWPVDLGSEFSCSEATARLFASMGFGCLRSAPGSPQDGPPLPGTSRRSRACGTVASRSNPDHFRVYVTFGRLSCAEARRIVPQGINIQHGWTYWDWTKGGNHDVWSDVFERDDAGVVVTAIWVKG
jgi:hypothetical protein